MITHTITVCNEPQGKKQKQRWKYKHQDSDSYKRKVMGHEVFCVPLWIKPGAKCKVDGAMCTIKYILSADEYDEALWHKGRPRVIDLYKDNDPTKLLCAFPEDLEQL